MIEAMAADKPGGDILFLHARTVFESRRPLPPGTPAGHRYDLRTLIGEDDLPEHVELVWHGVNDHANLRHFLASPVRWGECDVRHDPAGRLALRHDPFGHPAGAPLTPEDGAGGTSDAGEGDEVDEVDEVDLERPLPAEEVLSACRDAGKAVKLDVKEPGVLGDVLALVKRVGIASHDLWVNGRLDVLGPEGARLVRAEHPDAVVQVPVDTLAPMVLAAPGRARVRLDELASWGVSRFSLAWDTTRTAALLDRFDQWGDEVNLYAVEGLADFLRAVVLLPRSVTADFNFPEWHYFGRGAGRGGRHHRYHLDPAHPVRPTIDVA
jgi:hypothetical protein